MKWSTLKAIITTRAGILERTSETLMKVTIFIYVKERLGRYKLVKTETSVQEVTTLAESYSFPPLHFSSVFVHR